VEKKPAKSMKGIMSTGVKVTATCLFEKVVAITMAYPVEALKIRIRVIKNKPNCSTVLLRPMEK